MSRDQIVVMDGGAGSPRRMRAGEHFDPTDPLVVRDHPTPSRVPEQVTGRRPGPVIDNGTVGPPDAGDAT